MGFVENSVTTMAPLLLRSLITPIVIFADNCLSYFSQKCKLLGSIRFLLVTCFLFCLRLLPSFHLFVQPESRSLSDDYGEFKLIKHETRAVASRGEGDSAIARALAQLLAILNEIPVNSRKYEVVRSLAERLIYENQRENASSLREVNRAVLSAAFYRTLNRLEAALAWDGGEPLWNGLNRLVRAVLAPAGLVKDDTVLERSAVPTEKYAAELLWLSEKLVACGFGEDAVGVWAAASRSAWLSLSADARLQSSMVKISAFLLKQAKDMGREEAEEATLEQHRKTKMRLVMSWLPLLCRASNGVDAPVLTPTQRADLEKVLEGIIESLERDEQERVLSLWLHHFTRCSSSDWPNLHDAYVRWCSTSRKLHLFQ